MRKEYKVRRYGYDRRRQRRNHALRTVLLVILIAGACVAGWLLYKPVSAWLQEESNSYAERRQEQREQQEQQRQEQEQQNTPAGSPDEPDEPSVPADSTFPKKTATLAAGELADVAALESRLQELAAAGYDGILFDLKDDAGQVLYQSTLEAVTQNPKQTAARYDLTALIAAAEKAGLTPVGRMVAFRDGTAGRMMKNATVKYNYTETNWLDNAADAGGKSWLNPNSGAAQEYILSLLEEAAKQGLRCIVLDGVQFPIGYSLELATYGPKGTVVDRSTVLAAFVMRATAAMRQQGCAVWTSLKIGNLITPGGCYGDTPEELLTAGTDYFVLDIAPEQLLARREAMPQQPYERVHAALEQLLGSREDDSFYWVAAVQGYAPTTAWPYDTPFGESQINDQIRAARDYDALGVIVDTVR